MSAHRNPVPVALSEGEQNALKAIRVDAEMAQADGAERENYEQLRDCIEQHLEGLKPDEVAQVVAALAWIGVECLKVSKQG